VLDQVRDARAFVGSEQPFIRSIRVFVGLPLTDSGIGVSYAPHDAACFGILPDRQAALLLSFRRSW